MKLRNALSAALAGFGCCVVGLGCLLPYAQVCDVAVRGCPPNFHPSLLNDEYNETSWLVAEPALAILFSAVAAVLLLAGGRLLAKMFAAATLAISGTLAFAFFIGIYGVSLLSWASPGPVVGAFGAFLIAIAGTVVATGVLREARNHGA